MILLARFGSSEVEKVQAYSELRLPGMSRLLGRTGSDAELIERAKAGDRRCVEILLDPARVRRLMSGSRRWRVYSHELDDFTQDVIVRAFEGIEGFEGSTTRQFDAWLRGIGQNCYFELARRNARQRSRLVSLDKEAMSIGMDPIGFVVTREATKAALRELNTEERLALVLRAWGGLDYDEIADRMGYSTSTIRGKVARARRSLARRLREQ